jgi:type III restriction enzyme
MAYVVDRVVICDAYAEPNQHYQLLPGGKSKLASGRRPSMRFLASAKAVKGGIAGVVGKDAGLFDDLSASAAEQNDFVIQLRDEIRVWRERGYSGTAMVTRRLLEWWFERDEERKAIGRRFFFCQQEAIETLIYLYEVQGRRKMPETADLLRYALKLATGTGKTVVMALIVTWSTLHKKKVSGSSLSTNFLVLVPNLTVLDRVRGVPRGDGIDPAGEHNLYDFFDTVPPEYREEFQPNVLVRNWQSIPLKAKREDWIGDDVIQDGRFVPQSVLRAMRRRAQSDPNAPIRRLLGGWRDLIVINDEAHHVYGEKRARRGEDPDYIKWSKILGRVGKAARVCTVVDMSATPWYGSGSPKPDGTLFEWLISDFSVYDAFESGLVKVVRLPDPDEQGRIYIDLWDLVKGAKTKEEYLGSSKAAIETIYASWKKNYDEWTGTFEFARVGPPPVLLCVTDNATRAGWLFDHLTTNFDLFRNADAEDRKQWVTIPIDSKVFDADKGNEAVLREMVNTVGAEGKTGENVRCIVSVNMLTEGWDVKSVTHILGLRAFGSPLLTEQIIGRGLRRTDYDILNQPLAERPEGSEETVDAFGIPFVGFPVERRKRPRAGQWGQKPVAIEADPKKEKFRVRVPNVRSWAVGVKESLAEVIRVEQLPESVFDYRDAPDVHVKPVVGGQPEAVLTLEEFRREWPLLKTSFLLARELFDATNPQSDENLDFGPTFDELLDVVRRYLESRVRMKVSGGKHADLRDVGIYAWRREILDVLLNAVRNATDAGVKPIPITGRPEWLDSANIRRFHWTGIVADGKRCHLNRVPCHVDLERQFADFLDRAKDVVRYFKNERFGFSVTYYENNRPRQYYPDFIVVIRDRNGHETTWIAETKGEIRPNTKLKSEAARAWCVKMSTTAFGEFRYLFVPQRKFEAAMDAGAKSLSDLARAFVEPPARPQLKLVDLGDPRVAKEKFKTMLPLYSLKAAAGYFGNGEAVEPEGWIDASSVGRLDERMFVTRAVGRSMEPVIHDGDLLVFRAHPTGTRQNKIVLAQYRGPSDPDTGGAYTVKKYTSTKSHQGETWEHAGIVLSPLNREYAPIAIPPGEADDFRILAEFIAVLQP